MRLLRVGDACMRLYAVHRLRNRSKLVRLRQGTPTRTNQTNAGVLARVSYGQASRLQSVGTTRPVLQRIRTRCVHPRQGIPTRSNQTVRADLGSMYGL